MEKRSSTIFNLQLTTIALSLLSCASQSQNWLNHGGDLHNRRYASNETKISPKTVPNLALKWKFKAGRDITATPAIYNGVLYFPSWDGFIYAVNASNGNLIWKQNIQQITGIKVPAGTVSGVNVTVARATPTIAEDLDLVIVGVYGPGVVVALHRVNGLLAWMTKLDDHSTSAITMSGTYYNGGFYVGTSSFEEGKLGIGKCCTFRGSFSKLNAKTGMILWKTFMLPDNNNKVGNYSGAAIWGSSPAIDISRNHVYIATGNLYTAPKRVTDCQAKENNQTFPTHPDQCIEPDNHSESFLALDLDTGAIKWYHQLGGYDVWFSACNNPSTPNCPPGPNPDADFGEAPMLLTVNINGTMKDIAVAVQKSGFAWALDRNNGNVIWSTAAGPGGKGGGGTWGAATDEKKIYTNIANTDGKTFTLKPSTKTTNSGGWVAIDASTGKVIWSTSNPSKASASGPVSVANKVIFAGSTSPTGPLYAMDADVGNILWSFQIGATIYGGVSISNGCVYVGNGYKVAVGVFNPSFTAGNTLFAFCV